MPIFMNYEGISGVISDKPRGGVNTMMGDGSVKFIRGSINRSFGDSSNGGVWKSTNFPHPAASNVIEVSRISLPDAASDVLDASDASAAVKARALFRAARGGFGLSDGVVVSTVAEGVAGAGNNLRQIAMSGRAIPLVKIFVGNSGNSTRVEIELENVLVSSYSLSGHGGDSSSATNHFSLNFTKIRY